MKLVDDRTSKQMKTHTWIVAGTDKILSGWGLAKGGTSYAGWACTWEDLQAVEAWVLSRSDMLRVRIVGSNWRPRGTGYTHIYVVEKGHPALN